MLPVHKSMHVMVLDVMLDVVAVTVLDVIVLSVTVLDITVVVAVEVEVLHIFLSQYFAPSPSTEMPPIHCCGPRM